MTRETYPQKVGGREVFLYHLTNELASRENNIWLLCEKGSGERNKNIHYIEQKLIPIPRLRFLSFFLSSILSFKKVCKEVEIINAHFHDINCLLLPLLKAFFKIPYVITVHGGGLKRWGSKLLFKIAYGNASCVITVSESIKKEYEKRGIKNITTIPPVLPVVKSVIDTRLKVAENGLNPEGKIILFLGRLTPNKHPDLVLEAFRSLGMEYITRKKLSLVYVGGGPLKGKLENMIQEYRLEKWTKIVGSVPHEQVSGWFEVADLYILPSDYEGFPLSIVEAMSHGVPVIATDTRGINEIITHGKNGLLFPIGNIQALKTLLIEMFESELKRKEIGDHAKKFIEEHYSFGKIVNDYISVYEDVISKWKSGSPDQNSKNPKK